MILGAIKDAIAKRLSETEEGLSVIRRRLKGFAHGVLIVREEKGYRRYYLRSEKTEKSDRYLGKADSETVRELELKHYYNLLEKAASQEVVTLKKCQKLLEKIPDYDKVFYGIPEHKRNLIEPFSIAVNPKMPEWWRKEYITHKNIPVDTDYKTEGGVRLRSKSELIIAERFERACIPYRYEYPVTVGNGLWFPDFLVLNTRTGKEYIWEHFGMIDDENYCKSMQEKLETYSENGIFAGQNLITTSESRKHPLNTEYVDRLIRKFLN